MNNDDDDDDDDDISIRTYNKNLLMPHRTKSSQTIRTWSKRQ